MSNCGGGYNPTDFTLAVSSGDACRFPEPEKVPLLEWWRTWWEVSESKEVRVNGRETGTVVGLRERDMMLRVQVEAGVFLFPMRTTEAVEV